MNLVDLENKSMAFIKYNQKTCQRCGCNGSIKKWVFHFGRNRTAKLCVRCCDAIGNQASIIQWLEKQARYSSDGRDLLGFEVGN